MSKLACLCCGYLTFDSNNYHFDVCPVCFWEWDELQNDNPHYDGGANHESLTQARQNFLAFGASASEYKDYVRAPLPEEYP